MIHLDTDIIIAYLRGETSVAKRLQDAGSDIAISAVVLAELLYGARLSARAEANKATILRLLSIVPALPFDQACANAYAELKAGLKEIGKPTGEADVLIAATAIAHDVILVSHNRRHFENLSGLKLEDWLA